MFSSTGPGRHGWDDNLTCFDLGQQIIISAFLWGLSVRVFLCRAVVSRVRVSDSRVLYTPVIFGSFFSEVAVRVWRFPLRLAWFFSFRLPLATGGGLLCACWKVLRIVEARGFSTVSHVVWPVHFIIHALCRWRWWCGVDAAVVVVAF